VNTHLPGYKLISFYCRKIYENGGVPMFVKPILDASPVKLLSIEKTFECAAFKLNNRKRVLQNY
jgi:hypothetical protein